jgi:hypothetical protein
MLNCLITLLVDTVESALGALALPVNFDGCADWLRTRPLRNESPFNIHIRDIDQKMCHLRLVGIEKIFAECKCNICIDGLLTDIY